MPIPNLGHQEDYTVRAYDIDAHKRMTAPSLLRILNEAAMQHVLKLKLSVLDLEQHNIGWVLLRLDIHIKRLPDLGERIRIRTTPSGIERAFTYRDYYVLDEKGEVLATGSTTWILMNIETRRPTRIPSWIVDQMPEMPTPENCLPRPGSDLDAWEQADSQQQHRVGWYDLDFNWHLSNTHYLGLLIDSVPADFLRTHFPSMLRIHYKLEAKLEDELVSESQSTGTGSYRHRLRKGEQTLAEAASIWQKIEASDS